MDVHEAMVSYVLRQQRKTYYNTTILVLRNIQTRVKEHVSSYTYDHTAHKFFQGHKKPQTTTNIQKHTLDNS